jgi:hypothetical protein
MECRLGTVDQRHVGPELLATLTTPIPYMKRNDLVGGRIGHVSCTGAISMAGPPL